ncbi:hypothetical protein [Nocardia altamirensis]|uniref:hypothetical protein n=1 Tax=Nocardia altamirensis TaxID=472158 RepID=UPI00084035F0|nr:hypothetical protein [Nocardia altamirensis]
MRSIAKFSAGLAALVAVAPITLAATAHAADATADGAVYFSYGTHNCAILANGTIGCDRPVLTMAASGYGFSTPQLRSPQVIADPQARDGFDYFGKPYTLPGGNPHFDQVVNATDHYGFPALAHAGRMCSIGPKGIFICGTPSSGGGYYDRIIL